MRLNIDSVKHIKREIKRWEKIGTKKHSILAGKLGVSRQTASIWYDKYITNKLEAKSGQIPGNKFSEEFNKNIVDLYLSDSSKLMERLGRDSHRPTLSDFRDFNFISCSTEHIRTTLIKNDTHFARPKRKTMKQIRKSIRAKIRKLKNGLSDETLVTKLQEQLEILNNYKPSVMKSGIAGDIIEIDACNDVWINNEKQHIYFAVDAFTNTLLGFWIEKEETTIGYINLLKEVFKTYGRPREVRADKRRTFWGSKHTMTRMGEMLSEFDIVLGTSSSPTYKPNVERAFQNAQNWFPYYFMNKGFDTVADIRKNSLAIIKTYNSKKKYSIPNENSFLEMNNDLVDQVMVLKEQRIVSVGNTISLNNIPLAPYKNGKRQMMIIGAKITVFTNESRELFILHNQQKYTLQKAKDIISTSYKKWTNKIDHEKRKMSSFKQMLDKHKNLVNSKVKELQNNGVLIDYI
ncbi:MAG: DDE-type integrase/transposase/recombinase [Mycoplasmataceae bacterium]|nr:DDE-type integrase/transposase/recombinase [Mycoplasmataceae bacterium]